MRSRLINENIRIDGRKPEEIRPITCETKVLPRNPWFCVFTRGETQALAVTTLGAREDEKMIDNWMVFHLKDSCCTTISQVSVLVKQMSLEDQDEEK